jgi:HD-like signal output (HDOD) protein
LALQNMETATANLSLEQVFETATLPALPQTAVSLMRLSQDPNAGPNDFARVIESDPGLMGQVLRFANSAFFGFSRTITSVQQSLTLIGSRSITNFALWNAVFTVIPNPKVGTFDLRLLWQDSLRRAIAARHLGKALKLPNADDLFAGALLQDMAIPILLKEMPQQYEEVFRRRATESTRLSRIEEATFGWNHGTAAAMLAAIWKLPPSFSELIRNHAELEKLLGQGPTARGPASVALASCLPSCQESEWAEREVFLDGFTKLIGAHPIDLGELIAKVDSEAAEFAPLMKLPAPATPILTLLNVAA